MDCLFCKIANHTVKSHVVFENSELLAFEDIRPQAPHHYLIIPKQHIATVNECTEESSALLGQMVLTAQQLAQTLDIAQAGYRLVFNCNPSGGQEVYHLHLHLLGGRQMHWPPG